jgi:enamine deaminase RidA (YjgF/YER057c/UK114 family)
MMASPTPRRIIVAVQRFSPEGLLQPAPYHHVAVGTGTRHVHVSGQTATTPDGSPVPTDLTGQVSQALRNTAVGLAGAGATFADVLRLTFYVTDWSPEKIGDFMAGVEQVSAELDLPVPMAPSSLIGVDYLFEPGVLVEIEATAILD